MHWAPSEVVTVPTEPLQTSPVTKLTLSPPPAMYAGTLTAVLAIPTYEKPVDTLADLPPAYQDGFAVGTLKDSSTEFLFRVGLFTYINQYNFEFFSQLTLYSE